jgi:hypothetical protein
MSVAWGLSFSLCLITSGWGWQQGCSSLQVQQNLALLVVCSSSPHRLRQPLFPVPPASIPGSAPALCLAARMAPSDRPSILSPSLLREPLTPRHSGDPGQGADSRPPQNAPPTALGGHTTPFFLKLSHIAVPQPCAELSKTLGSTASPAAAAIGLWGPPAHLRGERCVY